jgi:ubiquinone/menaquinone biosynthesis C-methylase UbiE
MVRLLKPSDLVYDIGCGTKPFAKLLARLRRRHIGIDRIDGFYSQKAIDMAGGADTLPVVDCAADAVLSGQVIEHLPDPHAAMAESYRILKAGGMMFISFPFLCPCTSPPTTTSGTPATGFGPCVSGKDLISSRNTDKADSGTCLPYSAMSTSGLWNARPYAVFRY